jgi:hypothetical protein
MTRKILAGFSVLAVLALGLASQSFAMPMTDNPKENILAKTMNGNLNSNGQEYILVGIAPTHKGEHATYKLIPKLSLGIDGVVISQQSELPQMILVATPPTYSGGNATYHWIPKPAPNPFDFVS